jgi:hypothetical protein
MPTLLVTIADAPAAAAGVPSLKLLGSMPTALVTCGGIAAVVAAGVKRELEAADVAGAVTLRLSFTTGTRTVRVAACRSLRA